MPRRNSKRALAAALLALLAAGCGNAPAAPQNAPPREKLGLMTSLPLYWPLGAGVEEIASGRAPAPWQRTAIEAAYVLEPLDSLAPIPGLAADAPATDPLAGLTRLAVIQPRGLSPADNVALDEWVRGGGHVLMVLDPLLTGDYDLPLGDPRRPPDTALIPPVVARWGMQVSYAADARPEASEGTRTLPGGTVLPFAQPGRIAILPEGAQHCALAGGSDIMASCLIGKGRVTLLADAAVFEHAEYAGEGGAGLRALIAGVFE
jgi:hypothetical protein